LQKLVKKGEDFKKRRQSGMNLVQRDTTRAIFVVGGRKKEDA